MRASTTPRREATRTVIAVIAALLTSCSGGGGGDNTPAPTVQLQAEPSEVESGGTTTLTWSSTNADTCQASGGWSGTKLVSGSEAVGAANDRPRPSPCSAPATAGPPRPAPSSPCWARRAPIGGKPARADDFALGQRRQRRPARAVCAERQRPAGAGDAEPGRNRRLFERAGRRAGRPEAPVARSRSATSRIGTGSTLSRGKSSSS